MLREKLEEFARKELTHDDHVVIEATGNAAAVVDVLSPYVDRVVIANPRQVRTSRSSVRHGPSGEAVRAFPANHPGSCPP